MSKILSAHVPTFLLKKIDPESIIRRYNLGEFQQIRLQKESVQIKSGVQIIGSSPSENIFSFRDKNNVTQTIATTNCHQYQGVAPSTELRCEWCRKGYPSSQSIGIPTRVLRSSDTYLFQTEGDYCCFQCALAHLRSTRGMPLRFHEIGQNDSESFLKMHHALLYPGKDLSPAPHYRLHKRNGGCLEDSEFFADQSVYTRIPCVVTQAVKQQYIKLASL